MKKYDYPHFGSEFIAVFNCRPSSKAAGRKAVLEKYGVKGWEKVKRINRTGTMAMYNVRQTRETKLYSRVVGEHADRYWAKRKERENKKG